MTKYERGYRDALEAVARLAQLLPSGPWKTEAEAVAAVILAGQIVATIRAISPRIPPDHIREMQRQVARELPAGRFVSPAPDDEAISRLVAASQAPAGCDGLGEVRVRVSDLRGALNALREVGR